MNSSRSVPVSGFTMVKNASILDFPIEASIRSVLPGVDEMIVNVGRSDDDTLERVAAIGDPRIRIIGSDWDHSRGPAMLADETERARRECRGRWGIYIQADEVLDDGAAERLREIAAERDGDPAVQGAVVDYRHFYGGFGTVASNRKWYRRECRLVRLVPDVGVRSFRDAQGFRAGPSHERIRCVRSGVVMNHYGWARPTWALAAKRTADHGIYPWRKEQDPDRPLLPWIPGIRRFEGEHPATVREWVAERGSGERLIAPWRFNRRHPRLVLSAMVERLTGWRPLEYRNYRLVR